MTMVRILVAVSFILALNAGSAPRPNVVFMLADQWRAQAFGYAGDPNARTPNIDKLHREGVSLVNAVAGLPVCCPSRATLLTGRRPLSHGVFMNDVPLPSKEVTLAEVLRKAGYDTAYIGKWHLDGQGRSAFTPPERRQGFDYWKALECTHNYNNSAYYADTPEKLFWEGYDAIAQTRDAQQYLRDRKNAKTPFFLFLSWGPPHDPYQTAPEKYRALFDPAKMQLRPNVPPDMEQKARKGMAGYYAHCAALDDCVGELLTTLDETRLTTNTIVIFSSDHGDLLGSHGAFHKQRPYEESIRVPLIFRWPCGLGTQPRELDALINSEDLMPTILGLCRASIPRAVQGTDFSRYLRGGKDPSDSSAILTCVAPFGQWTRAQGGREMRGLRTMRYTYVRDLNGPWLLFDNLNDPYQMTNMVNQPGIAQEQARLDATLARRLKKAKDSFLPATHYIQEWGYTVDANGTVPYTH
jgi:arylsulfatase A-like enzyme